MKHHKFYLFFILLLTIALLSGCGQSSDPKLQDGYYTAEMSALDDHGWKEFLTIYVSNGKIITAEYNAKNASGFLKSWDMNYMRTMNTVEGTYPNRYTRTYAADLITKQNDKTIDGVTGASHSHHTFMELADAVIQHAQVGDTSVAVVEAKE